MWPEGGEVVIDGACACGGACGDTSSGRDNYKSSENGNFFFTYLRNTIPGLKSHLFKETSDYERKLTLMGVHR